MQQIQLICKELPLLFLILPQMTLTPHLKTQIHLHWFILSYDKHIWLVIYTRSTLSQAYSAGDSLTRVS